MGVDIAVTRVACNTATGNQDITISGFGTPKAALFLVSSCITDGTAADHAIYCVGATDGTNHVVVGGRSRHSVAESDADRRGATDEVIQILEVDTQDVDGEANFNSWITDGVRITWGVALDAAYLMTVVLFTGSDLSANAGDFTSGSNGGEVDVDCGMEPDVAFFFCNGLAINDTPNYSMPCNLGFATNTTPIVNRAASMCVEDGNGTSYTSGAMHTSRCVVNQVPSDGTVSRSLSVSDFISNGTDGFTVLHHNGVHIGALASGYLALAFNGAVSFKAGTMDTPTDTGDDAQTGPGFTPQFAMLLMNPLTTVDSTDATQGAIGISTFTADDEYSIAVADEDNQADMDTQSLSDDTAVNLPQHDGSTGHVAAYKSMDANGWTLTFSETLGTACKWPWLAIEEVAAAAGRIPRHPAAYYGGPTIF